MPIAVRLCGVRGVCMAARCCASIGVVSASAFVHGVRGVCMTVRCATSAHDSLTYLAAKYVANGWRMA